MPLKISELISIFLLTWVSGMYWGPWLAVSRSFHTFKPEVFLDVVGRISRNMRPLMTVLTPIALLSTVPVLFLSYGGQKGTFYLTLIALILFIFTVIMTVLIEVPIVKQIAIWTPSTLPNDWQKLRDRWGSFHLLRIIPSVVGLVLLLIAAIF